MKLIILAIVILMILSGCADSSMYTVTTQDAHLYGFWGGLWHGIIVPFNAIVMLFSDDVAIYAPSNNGGFYAFGFFVGNVLLAGSSTKAAS